MIQMSITETIEYDIIVGGWTVLQLQKNNAGYERW